MKRQEFDIQCIATVAPFRFLSEQPVSDLTK